MVNVQNNPSLDPADNNTLAGSIRFAMSKILQKTDGMLPAKVISYDRTNNRVQVQILMALITTSGSVVPRPQIASIPVVILGGGGFMLSFPLNAGDLGWIVANDRDISNFLSTYDQTTPNTNRVKNFADGIFIPDIMTNYTLAPGSDDAVTLQSADGTSSVVMDTAGNVTITAAETVTINATHNLNVNASANCLFTIGAGAGILGVVGSIAATGTITPGATIPPPLP